MSKAVAERATPFSKNQQILCLPLQYLAGWLTQIKLSAVKEEALPLLIAFIEECYDALYNYWFKGSAINPRAGQTQQLGSSSEILRLMCALKKERNPAAARTIHQMLSQSCEQRGVETPALDDIAATAKAQDQKVFDELVIAVHALMAKDIAVNQHRKPDLFALHIPSLYKDCAKTSISLPSRSALYQTLRNLPSFVSEGGVNCIDGTARQCWVFEISAFT